MSKEENTTAQVSVADDTRTKKTIRLRPILSKAEPVIHPGPQIKPAVVPQVAPSAPKVAADQPNQTVKLKPLMPKIASTNQTIDPLAMPKSVSKDFDGGDTKTRRAIQLSQAKPTVKPATINIANAPTAQPVDTAAPNKTVKLKPLMPKIASKDQTVDPLAMPKSVSKDFDGNDTKTRRAVQLSQAQPTVKPATINIASASAPEEGGTDDDRTVKVKRPVLTKPAGAPRPALKFNRPAAPVTPTATPSIPHPAVAPAPAVAAVASADVDDESVDFDGEEEPDKLQFVLSIVAAVALLASGTLLALNFFNITF